MYIYNITSKVDIAVCSQWKNWQLQEHIPEIMQTKLFNDFKFYQLIDQEETDGITHVLQLFFSDKSNYEIYIEDFAPSLRKKAIEKWGDGFISYRTVMQSVQ
jgi:hypothetical protein